jgi:serine/threonine protein kinase
MTPQDATRSAAALPPAATLRLEGEALARARELSQRRPVPPAELPGYDIERCLGNGAYGSVWLASERNTGKRVAIKFYSHRRGLDWSLLNREVEKLAVLSSSRDVIGLMQVGWDADPPYYIMEYLQNGSLARLLEQGTLPAHEAVRIATAVTRALVHAHRHGILHCDVKPANVLLDGDFAPRLADFGQARLSNEQSPALGTLFYMAPEQADLDAAPDPRWDIYAMGALLYEMLCGELPFRSAETDRLIEAADSLEEKLALYRQAVATSPRPAAHRQRARVDARLADIIDRCLAVDPSQRFADAEALAEALETRARYRALRPAIALGIVLPGLLMLALFPLAATAVTSAAGTAEKNIAARALESDSVTARLLAYVLDDDLTQRSRTLEQIADETDLLELIREGADSAAGSDERQKLDAWLSQSKEEIDRVRRERFDADLDDSWFLTDSRGFQRWREPAATSIDQNFAWRDYFHGQGDDRPDWKGREEIPPLTEPHISAPFRSSTTGQLKVAITVPVWDEEHREVLGVLGRTIRLGQVLTSYKRQIREEEREQQVRRVIALVDVRTGKILDHPWMSEGNSQRLSDNAVFEKLTLSQDKRHELEQLLERVRQDQEAKTQLLDAHYSDPIRHIDDQAEYEFGVPWLAAFCPVGDTGWFALVQEPRDDALRPVREIQTGLIKYALAGLLFCLTLIVTTWYFVRRVMRTRPLRLRAAGGA